MFSPFYPLFSLFFLVSKQSVTYSPHFVSFLISLSKHGWLHRIVISNLQSILYYAFPDIAKFYSKYISGALQLLILDLDIIVCISPLCHYKRIIVISPTGTSARTPCPGKHEQRNPVLSFFTPSSSSHPRS